MEGELLLQHSFPPNNCLLISHVRCWSGPTLSRYVKIIKHHILSQPYLPQGPFSGSWDLQCSGCLVTHIENWLSCGWCPAEGWPGGKGPPAEACGCWSRTHGSSEVPQPHSLTGAAARHTPRRCWPLESCGMVWGIPWCVGHLTGWAPRQPEGLVQGTSTPRSPQYSGGGPAPLHVSGAPSSNHWKTMESTRLTNRRYEIRVELCIIMCTGNQGLWLYSHTLTDSDPHGVLIPQWIAQNQ